MAFSQSQTQIMDDVSVSGGGTSNSGDFTLSTSHTGRDCRSGWSTLFWACVRSVGKPIEELLKEAI